MDNQPINETKDTETKKDIQAINTPAAIMVAGVFIAAAILISRAPAKSAVDPNALKSALSDQQAAQPQTIAPITDQDHVQGEVDSAKVTIVEYSDLECPFCKEYHSTLEQIVSSYGDKVAWVYRHYPLDSLHPKSRHEAEASECAAEIGGNTAFWKYVDMVFKNTPSNNQLDPKMLPKFAQDIGLDTTKFNSCLDSGKFATDIDNDVKEGQRLGIQGTPYTVIVLPDGKQVPFTGAKDFPTMKKVIDAAIGQK
jgi:protein-disulfide isomerase